MIFLVGSSLIALAIVLAAVVFRAPRQSPPTGMLALTGAVTSLGSQAATNPTLSALTNPPTPAIVPRHPRAAMLDEREAELERRDQHLQAREARVAALTEECRSALEEIGGLSTEQAREQLLREVTEATRFEALRRRRQVEEQVQSEADSRARAIVMTAMQRIASPLAAETTVTVVQLPDDAMKGRIIGREGRNIRTFQAITGVDLIIDDAPCTVVLSSFDNIRRELARLTLTMLVADGRIQPVSIEETYEQAKVQLEMQITRSGEDAVLDSGVGGLAAELVQRLGKLRFRTSYGQNVLAHSVECARLAGLIAGEVGVDVAVARRAALLHDIGKGVGDEIEGPHAFVGAELARRHGESEAVAHAIEVHHNERVANSIEAIVVQVADALSSSRPGARAESLERYVTRLREIEEVAARHNGVEKVFALQAGRELRVIVAPDVIDDDQAALLVGDIAREIEQSLEYPGQIKVTVIRESRASAIAH